MKLEDILEQRKNIMGSLHTPVQQTPLFGTDITDHRHQIEKVYKGMLHEACVIDNCCRRFEKMFGRT